MDQTIRTLFTKYLEDQCSEQELLRLLDHFKVPSDEMVLKELILEEIKQQEVLETPASDADQRLGLVYDKIKLHIEQQPIVRKVRLWPRIAVAASITLVMAAGAYMYVQNEATSNQEPVYAGDVLPGKNAATLTLASGKKIILSDKANGELANESGMTITKTANGQLVYLISNGKSGDRTSTSDKDGANKTNMLSTARCETYSIKLPDGTLVVLNAASSLRYPASFATLNSREVELTGEAYFEVAKDKAHPFIVKTNEQKVEVLGTHFNINAYVNENETRTTLLEGSVRVSSLKGTEGPVEVSKILKPGDQSLLLSNQLTVNKINTEEIIAWKNGDFDFNGEDVKSIMRQLSRWYDIDVVYQGNVTKEVYYAKISRNKNISAVLKHLEEAGGVHFKIEGRRIIVMP